MLPLEKDNDTIAAIATASGRAGIAVVRLSGQASSSIAQLIFRSTKSFADHTREMLYGHVHDVGEDVDEALACYMKAPHSYTGEDVVEIQCHGGYAAARLILDLLIKNGARHAEPGEFTKRAFLNGRIDLVQAESVMEIVNAENQEHLKLAERLMDGIFSARIQTILDTLNDCLAQLELNINFPTQGIAGIDVGQIASQLLPVRTTLENMIASYKSGRKIRDGFSVVFAGTVNAGKSSLFNAILGRKRAIVTDIPGTTRDWLEEKIELDGLTINVIDTAGIRETVDGIELEGVRESSRLVSSADIVIHMIEANDSRIHDTSYLNGHANVIHVLSKCDLDNGTTVHPDWIHVSALAGTGIDSLLETLSKRLHALTGTESHDTVVIVDRHRTELEGALESLIRASDALTSLSEEFAVLELKESVTHIEMILGKTIDVDILDTIFSRFCIGK